MEIFRWIKWTDFESSSTKTIYIKKKVKNTCDIKLISMSSLTPHIFRNIWVEFFKEDACWYFKLSHGKLCSWQQNLLFLKKKGVILIFTWLPDKSNTTEEYCKTLEAWHAFLCGWKNVVLKPSWNESWNCSIKNILDLFFLKKKKRWQLE